MNFNPFSDPFHTGLGLSSGLSVRARFGGGRAYRKPVQEAEPEAAEPEPAQAEPEEKKTKGLLKNPRWDSVVTVEKIGAF